MLDALVHVASGCGMPRVGASAATLREGRVCVRAVVACSENSTGKSGCHSGGEVGFNHSIRMTGGFRLDCAMLLKNKSVLSPNRSHVRCGNSYPCSGIHASVDYYSCASRAL